MREGQSAGRGGDAEQLGLPLRLAEGDLERPKRAWRLLPIETQRIAVQGAQWWCAHLRAMVSDSTCVARQRPGRKAAVRDEWCERGRCWPGFEALVRAGLARRRRCECCEGRGWVAEEVGASGAHGRVAAWASESDGDGAGDVKRRGARR